MRCTFFQQTALICTGLEDMLMMQNKHQPADEKEIQVPGTCG